MSGSPKLRHLCFFWLRNPGSEADRDRLIAGLRTLASIDVVEELKIGVPAGTEARAAVDHSYDVAELMIFADEAAQLAYQQHPVHKAFVADCQHLWGKHVVYDMVDVG